MFTLWLIAAGLIALTIQPAVAHADEFGIGAGQAAPIYQTAAAGNVDAKTGHFTTSGVDLSVGSGSSATRIDVARLYDSKDATALTEFGNGGRVSLKSYITCLGCPQLFGLQYFYVDWINVQVSVGNATFRFDKDAGGNYTNALGDGASFKRTSSTRFEFTTREGDVTIYDLADQFICGAAYMNNSTYGLTGQPNCIFARYQQFADGNFWNYTYERVHKTWGVVVQNRLKEVINSRGYGVRFSYVNPNTGDGYDRKETLISRIEAFRASCTPTSGVVDCSSGTLGASTYTYVELTHSNAKKYWVLNTSTDMRGNVTTYGYDADLQLAWARYPANPTVMAFQNTYTGGKVTQQLDAASRATGYTYGATQTEIRDPLSNLTTYTFAASGLQPLSIVDATIQTTSFEYDSFGRTTKVTSPEGDATVTIYDTRGNVTSSTRKAKPGSALPDLVSSATFPACDVTNFRICNKPELTIDSKGAQTDYQYDAAHGGVTAVLSPPDAAGLRAVTRWQYGTFAPAPSTDPPTVTGRPNILVPSIRLPTIVDRCLSSIPGVTFGFVCPAADTVRREQVYTPSSTTTRTSYELESVTVDPGAGNLSLRTAFTYDKVGNRLSEDGPRSDGDVTTYAYDAGRLVTQITAPTVGGVAPRTSFAYDANNRQISISRSFGAGQQTSSVEFNSLGQLWRTTAADGAVIINDFYDNGWPRDTWQVVDGVMRRTRTSYDAAGRALELRSAVGTGLEQATATYTYTGNGQVQTQKDANNNVTTSCFDGFDRRVELRYPSVARPGTSPSCAATPVGSMPAGSDYEAWNYAANGDLASMRRRDGQTIAYQFDNLGRLTQRTPPAGNDAYAYTYDLLGRRIAATIAGAPSRSLTWAYDKAGRVTSAGQGSRALAYAYDPGVTWMQMTWPDNLAVRRSSDAMGRPTTIAEIGGPTLASYSYDELSRRTSVAFGNGTQTSYAYDAATFHLSALSHDLAGTARDVRFDLGYNAASEIVSRTRDNDAYAWLNNTNETLGYEANGLNQYTAAGVRRPVYDARGNMTMNRLWSYSYDVDNRLTAVRGPSSADLAYDAAGRLARNTSAGGTHELLYDGSDLVAEYDAGGALLRRHVHGPGIDEPIVTYEGGQRRWLYPDVQGSIIALADDAGNAVAVNAYGPYGEPNQVQTGRFGLTGQASIEGVPLYDFRARAYAPRFGRFLQADPIGTDGGMNLYEYAASDPVNNSDPSGTDVYGPPGPVDLTITGNRLNATVASSRPAGGGGWSGGGSPSLANIGRDIGWPGIPFSNGRPPPYRPAPATPQRSLPYPRREGTGDPRQQPNGCGVAGGGSFIPQTFPQACGSHDICYSSLGISKSQCDREFYYNMIHERPDSKLQAFIYYDAVDQRGDAAYRSAQAEAERWLKLTGRAN